MKSHFAGYKHKTGIMLISMDSLLGYIRRLPEGHNYTLDDLADMLEDMVED